MENAVTDSGIDVIGHVPGGTHFSLFYQTKEDLIDVLIPYFKTGLMNNEFCMWVTAESLNAGEVKAYIAKAMPDFEAYFQKGQIEIIPYTEWYTINGAFDPERVLVGWIEKLRKAEERGFRGLRATGDVSWLETDGWKAFLDYELTVNNVIGRHEMIALCTYPLDGCDANDILDVVSTHQFTLTRRNGVWKIIEDQGQKKARKSLRESEEKLRSYYDLPLIGMALTSPEKGWVQANDEICRILGYSREELFRMSWDKITYPDDLKVDDGHFNRLLAGEIENYTIEKRFVRKDGGIVPTEISIGCIRNLDKSVHYVVGLMRDITERKQAEGALKEAKQQAELYLDLMGHDISNMHQIAMGYLELAEEMAQDVGQKELIKTPTEVLQRSARLIQNVQKLQRNQSSGYEPKVLDLGDVIEDVVSQHKEVPSRYVHISVKPVKGMLVQANELLQDVFSNLIWNAITHSNGPVNINIRMYGKKKDDQMYWLVITEDNGPGIPDDFKEKIFNRILKGKSNTKGMGLGLYLVKSLVDSYGGHVWVEDRVNGDYTKGARFVVMLPAVDT